MSRHRSRAGELSQALTEFALVLPVLLFLVVGVFDVGRLFYSYITIQNAANEGARTAIRAAPPAGLTDQHGNPATAGLPSDEDVLGAARSTSAAVPIRFGTCPNAGGSARPDPGDAWLFISAPGGAPLAPGGGQAGAPGGCAVVARASGHVPLRVTVLYEFSPVTPFLNWAHFTIGASATYQTEY